MFFKNALHMLLGITLLFCVGFSQNHLPFSNKVPLLGHLNFIIPVDQWVENSVLVSSLHGTVSLFDYIEGSIQWIKNHREDEKVKKLYANNKHAVVFLTKDNSTAEPHGASIKDPNTYTYLNVYDIRSADLLYTRKYTGVVQDILWTDSSGFLLFEDRYEIIHWEDDSGSVLYFQDLLEGNWNTVCSKIINTQEEVALLFYIDKNLVASLIELDIQNKKIKKNRVIQELNITRNMQHSVYVHNRNVVIVHNQKYIQWVDISKGGIDGYKYGMIEVSSNIPEEETTTQGLSEIGNIFHSIHWGCLEEVLQLKHMLLFKIKSEKQLFQYDYSSNKMQFVQSLNQKEILGIININGTAELIQAKDEGHHIKVMNVDKKKMNTQVHILEKSENIYHDGEIIVGIQKDLSDSVYFLSVYNDSTFTVYKNNKVLYSREEALAYINQVYFYNFQHLKSKKKNTYSSFHNELVQEVHRFIKDKIRSFNKPWVDALFEEKKNRSLLPLNFFYLSIEEKMKKLQISTFKRQNNDMFTKSEIPSGLKKPTNFIGVEESKDHYPHMYKLLKDTFDYFTQEPSIKYSWRSIVLVSTCNYQIFAFHLNTGLILYKIDMNEFAGSGIMESLSNYSCTFNTGTNNWGAIENGRKIMFLSGDNKTKDHALLVRRKIELSSFKNFTKNSVITVLIRENKSIVVIFDILNGIILFKKTIDAFMIQQYFILKESNTIIALDSSQNIRILHVGNDTIQENINQKELYFYNFDTNQNYINGYKIIQMKEHDKNSRDYEVKAIKTYSIRVNEPIEVISKSTSRKSVFFPVRINKDATIRYKYINNNIVAYISKSTEVQSNYTLYAIDGITGNSIFSQILEKNAEPPFHLVVNENFIVLTYFHKTLNKFAITINELFLSKEDEGFFSIITSKKEKVVDLFNHPKLMIHQKNIILDHNTRSFNFTNTKKGITNKHFLVLLDTNKITSLSLMEPMQKNMYITIKEFITNADILSNSKGFITYESSFESTTLLFSWGDYIYYTYYQPNGSFDTIEHLHLFFLLFIIILAFIGVYISYIKRSNAKLHAHWM